MPVARAAGCCKRRRYLAAIRGVDAGLFLATVHLTLVRALKQLPPEHQLLGAKEFSQKHLEAVRKNIASKVLHGLIQNSWSRE
jgi:hypothetical protein